MNSSISQDIYINCFFFDKKNDKIVYRYMIRSTVSKQYPYQLFRQNPASPLAWENRSIYPSLHDTVLVLLKELLTEEVADEIHHGQATIDPNCILNLLSGGESSVSVFSSVGNELLGSNYDVSYEELIQRGTNRRKRINRFKKDNG